MGASTTPGPLGVCSAGIAVPEDVPSVFGFGLGLVPRDSPGPLGFNDWAGFVALRPLLIPMRFVMLGCACDRDITLDELCKVFSKQKKKVCEEYLPHINATCLKYGISTCLRKAHFLAQVGHESGELRYSAEVLPKGKKEADVYDGYKGRGLIQLTYARNYKAYGKAINHDFLDTHKAELEESAWATDSAGWYWTSGSGQDLNGLADKNDLLAITARVNGAFNGFEDRRLHFVAALKAFNAGCCKSSVGLSETYLPFAESQIYENRVQSFAWGCWNDAKAGKKGVVKSVDERKAGYQRFLDLNAEFIKSKKKEHNHFGFSPAKMLALATDGVK